MSDDEKYVYGAHPIEIIIAIRESSYHLPDERDPGSVRDCCDMLTDEIGRLEQRIKELEAFEQHVELRQENQKLKEAIKLALKHSKQRMYDMWLISHLEKALEDK